jgi:hypothetical protein
MKGPFENNKVYAIAGHGKAGIAGGVIPAVYAHDAEYSENRFFTVGRDEADEAADRDDVFSANTVGELILDSSQDAGYRVPDRQVLSLWSQRDEALAKFTERSERGKAAVQTAKTRKAAELAERLRADREAQEASAEGRIEALPGIMRINRIIRPERDKVFITLHMSPERFKKFARHVSIPDELVEEWLTESADQPVLQATKSEK